MRLLIFSRLLALAFLYLNFLQSYVQVIQMHSQSKYAANVSWAKLSYTLGRRIVYKESLDTRIERNSLMAVEGIVKCDSL